MAVNQNVAKAPVFLAGIMVALALVPLGCPSRGDPNAARLRAVRSAPGYVRAALPVLDIHTHIDPRATDVVIPLLDERNIRVAVNLSGGVEGAGLEEAMAQDRATHGRIIAFCTLSWRNAPAPDFVAQSIAVLERCHALGAHG